MALKWNGARVAKRVRAAELAAVQETIDAAAELAAGARTGRAADIRADAAEPTARGARGRWGYFPEPHGEHHAELMVETGTAYLPGDNAKRRAADAEYPKLSERIRRRRA